MSTNNQYKLPTDIGSRFDTRFYEHFTRGEVRNVIYASREALKDFITTEQVRLLEWMLGEIGEDEKWEYVPCGVDHAGMCIACAGGNENHPKRDIEKRNTMRKRLRAKVQAKLQEYKV